MNKLPSFPALTALSRRVVLERMGWASCMSLWMVMLSSLPMTSTLNLQPQVTWNSCITHTLYRGVVVGHDLSLLLRRRRNRHAMDYEQRGPHVCMRAKRIVSSESDKALERTKKLTNNLDELRAQAGVLRTSIFRQQQDLAAKQEELEAVERRLEAALQSSRRIMSMQTRGERTPLQSLTITLDRTLTNGVFTRTINTFLKSYDVLQRKLLRVEARQGKSNRNWNSVTEYVAAQSITATRIVSALAKDPRRLTALVDPDTPSLIPHMPAILARLDRLESHVAPILENVLNNRRHLASIEPYLEEVLERFDDIEPHLPWILEHIDLLGPYTGLLLKHIDELLLYANIDESEGFGNKYALAEQLLPFLEFYVSRLDLIGEHLPYIRPHIPKLLKHGSAISTVTPYVDKLFAKGNFNRSISANLDILLFYFGWALKVPLLPQLFFSLPFAGSIVRFLATRMPRRFVRGPAGFVTCSAEGDAGRASDPGSNYGDGWNRLRKELKSQPLPKLSWDGKKFSRD